MSDFTSEQLERWLNPETWSTSSLRSAIATHEFAPLCREVLALRKQVALDRQSREASRVEVARLSNEIGEERWRIGNLLDEIASVAISAGMMDPERRASLDGPNAIQFLRQIKADYAARRD